MKEKGRKGKQMCLKSTDARENVQCYAHAKRSGFVNYRASDIAVVLKKLQSIYYAKRNESRKRVSEES